MPRRDRATIAIFVTLAATIGCARPAIESTSLTSRPQSSPAADRFALIVAREFQIDPRLTLATLGDRPTAATRPTEADEGHAVVELPGHQAILLHEAPSLHVRLLPEESRTADRFGIVVADHALLHQTTVDRSGDRDNVSDVLKDEPVWILDRDDAASALFVHASDGYLGWVNAGAIRVVDHTEFVTQLNADAVAPAVAAVIADAKTFLHTPYAWGGKTNRGIDCSGLTQVSFGRHGVLLPRDAYQQANVGRLVATRYFIDALRPGDLMFFTGSRRGNVSHVAIYLGDGQYIEAAGDDVHVSSMRPGDASYDAKRMQAFAWARRVLE